MLKQFNPRFFLRKKFLAGLVVILLAVVVLEIWSVNHLATYGEQVTKMETSIASLRLENQLMENEIAAKSSLSNLQSVSGKLGLAPAAKIEYLKAEHIALNH